MFNLDNVKKQGLALFSFHARHYLFNLLLSSAISPIILHSKTAMEVEDYALKHAQKRQSHL
jgi:hypothetical protein